MLISSVVALAATSLCAAQAEGRIFLPVSDTIAIYEFNDVQDGELSDGTVISDGSGNGLDAVVEHNGARALALGPGDAAYGAANREARRLSFDSRAASIVVDDDGDAFEMNEYQSFSLEMYIHREDLGFAPEIGDWGILAGTWHSRYGGNDDDAHNLWYGWGLIRYGWEGTRGWAWVASPVPPDGRASPGFNEHQSRPVFEIPFGRHYLAVACDREEQMVRLYLDAVLVATLPLEPWMAFITPYIPGTDTPARHARFMMLNGENDPTHPNVFLRYMTPPPGFQLDAVRLLKRALTPQEIEIAWEDIQSGRPNPSTVITAVIEPSATTLVPNQCVRLDGGKSLAGAGRTIVSYAWKVGDGAFMEGAATLETSFAEEHPAGIPVTLRVTNDAAQTAEGTITLKVAVPAPQGSIRISVDGEESFASPVLLARGRALSVAAVITTPWNPPVFQCPLTGGLEIPAPAIASYSWDLNGDGLEDSNAAEPPAWVAATAGEFTITLTATNSLGATTTCARRIKVADNRGNSRVFHTTADTILHLEFNDLPDDRPLDPAGTDVTLDLSPSSLELAFYDVPDDGGGFGHFSAVPGAPQFADANLAVKLRGRGPDGMDYLAGPHGIIEEDDDVFEMGVDDDFTFEMYFIPGAGTMSWTGLAGTWRCRAEGNEEDPRYGWGFMALPQPNQYVWFNCNGEKGAPGEKWGGLATVAPRRYAYVAVVTDRAADRVTTYVDGLVVSQYDIGDSWTLETPEGYPYHAYFCLFARQQRDFEFSTTMPGCTIDAVRVRRVALTAAQIEANHQDILEGLGADHGGAAEPRFKRGMANADNKIDISDAVFLLGYLFAGKTPPSCPDAADANDDGKIDISDPVKILGHLFAGAGPLPPPFSECGVDPTPDTLGPCVFPWCP